jgi:hypothetical protein
MAKLTKFYVTYQVAGNEPVTMTMRAADEACALGCVLDEQEEEEGVEFDWVTISRNPQPNKQTPRSKPRARAKKARKPGAHDVSLDTLPPAVLRAFREGLSL